MSASGPSGPLVFKKVYHPYGQSYGWGPSVSQFFPVILTPDVIDSMI